MNFAEVLLRLGSSLVAWMMLYAYVLARRATPLALLMDWFDVPAGLEPHCVIGKSACKKIGSGSMPYSSRSEVANTAVIEASVVGS